MAIKIGTVTGPAFLASALINGDLSGLESPQDQQCLERFLDFIAPARVVSTQGEQYFTWSYRLHGGDAGGGDVIDYVTHEDTP